jgi:hypothetical protein
MASGDQLRYDAKYNCWEHLRDILKNRANTASADEYGLTPLMYAVWNCHPECVRYLVCNDVGVDARGHRVSSLFMTTCKGYTALHLAAIDTFPEVAEEIAMLLLIAGIDYQQKDNEGHNAEELALLHKNHGFLLALQNFKKKDVDEKMKEKLLSLKKHLLEKYTFIHNPTMNTEKWNADFIVPDYVFNQERFGALPDGMIIHEHYIKPLIDEGYVLKDGVDALKCIDFAREQANINHERREKLVKADPMSDWVEVNRAEIVKSRQKPRPRGARRNKESDNIQKSTFL